MLVSWVLVVYMNVGDGLFTATGGPFAVPGFATQEACKVSSDSFTKMPHYSFSYCVRVQQPPVGAQLSPQELAAAAADSARSDATGKMEAAEPAKAASSAKK